MMRDNIWYTQITMAVMISHWKLGDTTTNTDLDRLGLVRLRGRGYINLLSGSQRPTILAL